MAGRYSKCGIYKVYTRYRDALHYLSQFMMDIFDFLTSTSSRSTTPELSTGASSGATTPPAFANEDPVINNAANALIALSEDSWERMGAHPYGDAGRIKLDRRIAESDAAQASRSERITLPPLRTVLESIARSPSPEQAVAARYAERSRASPRMRRPPIATPTEAGESYTGPSNARPMSPGPSSPGQRRASGTRTPSRRRASGTNSTPRRRRSGTTSPTQRRAHTTSPPRRRTSTTSRPPPRAGPSSSNATAKKPKKISEPAGLSKNWCNSLKEITLDELPDYCPPQTQFKGPLIDVVHNKYNPEVGRKAEFTSDPRSQRRDQDLYLRDDRLSEDEQRFVLSLYPNLTIDSYLMAKHHIFACHRWRSIEDGLAPNIESSQQSCSIDVNITSVIHKWFKSMDLFRPNNLDSDPGRVIPPRPDYVWHLYPTAGKARVYEEYEQEQRAAALARAQTQVPTQPATAAQA